MSRRRGTQHLRCRDRRRPGLGDEVEMGIVHCAGCGAAAPNMTRVIVAGFFDGVDHWYVFQDGSMVREDEGYEFEADDDL